MAAGGRGAGAWWTRANGVTLLRLLLAAPLVAALRAGEPALAALVLAAAVATDVADGHLARRFREASARGRLLDHAVDAAFVTAGTAALALRGVLPSALPPLIALAFLQYAVDSGRASAAGPRPSALGRWNGIAYYAAVAVPVFRDALGLSLPAPALVRVLGWALVASTLVSMAERLRFQIRDPQVRRRPEGP